VKKSVLLAVVFIVVVIGAVVYTTMSASASRYRCEVCMEFQGRRACRIASAATEMQARRTAQENACALISSGVTDSMQCGNYTEPVSVKWLSGK
jgi:hypothetical protein